jgi:hypothetical protein
VDCFSGAKSSGPMYASTKLTPVFALVKLETSPHIRTYVSETSIATTSEPFFLPFVSAFQGVMIFIRIE